MPSDSAARPVAAAISTAGAAAALLIGGAAAALAVAAAIAAAWCVSGSRTARTRAGAWCSGGFFVSLGVGLALAAGAGAGTVLFGLPLSLWGLLLGVFAFPLLLTGIGFVVSFEPPDARGLARLRQFARRPPP